MEKQFTARFPREKTPHDYEHIEALCGPDAYSTGHMDGWNDCRRAMLEAQERAQPPAASVTDAMVDAALTRAVIASKESGIKGPTRYMMRAALESALAAQEKPNG